MAGSSDITKRFGIIQGGTGSFGSIQFTDGDKDGNARIEIFDNSKNLKNITSVSASTTVQGGAASFASVTTAGAVVVGGDLTVNGTTTTVNSTTVQIDDLNLQLADGAAAASAVNGGGITLAHSGDDFTFQYNHASTAWKSSIDVDMATGKAYKINGTSVLNATTLGSAVVASSLTSVGALNAGSITSGFGSIDIGSSTFNAGASTVDSLDASAGGITQAGAVSGVTTLDASGLASLDGGINVADNFTVSAGGAVVAASLNNSSGGITNAGAISGATTISGSGRLDAGSIVTSGSATVGSLASSGAITGTTGTYSGVLKTDDTTEATSTTDGSLQTDGGLSVAKSAVVGDDLDLLSDAAILNFGADKDVNLTHVADTGLLLNSSMQLQFGDSGTYIHQSADGVLDLVSDTEIEINATTIDVNGAADFSGDATFGASIKFGVGSDHYINNKNGDNNLLLDSMTATVTAGGNFLVTTDLRLNGDKIKDSGGNEAITFDGSGNTDVKGTLAASGHITLANTKDLLAGGADCEIGSEGTKFAAGYFTNVYTGDMHLKNERGDWTIFEEADHLRIRNNLTGQTFKMGMTLIDE